MIMKYSCKRWKKKGKFRKLSFVVLLSVYFGFTTLALSLKASHLKELSITNTGQSDDAALHRRFRRDVENVTQPPGEEALNCTKRAIEEFPDNFFTFQQTKDGAIAVHIFLALYMFGALAIVCDDYFVSSLEVICERLDLQEDVAGATFMAAGSSAPEFFTSVIGVFIAKSDVGVGTIVGSAVFNILFIIGMCALTAGMLVKLTWYPMTRDCLFYLISITALVIAINDEKVYWYEATILIVLYMFYIIIMFFNRKLEEKIVGFVSGISKKYRSRPEELFVKDSEIEEKQPLSDQGTSGNYGGHSGTENLPVTNKGADTETSFTGESSESKPESLDAVGEYDSPWTFPDSLPARIYWISMLPMKALMYVSIPDCRRSGIFRRLYPITFVASIAWIAGCSYIMVWMVTIIGDMLDIPDTVMGLTILAAGTSVPDCLSSIFVARDGYGDMAVSNSIGSNVFDILMCLGLPWLLDTAVVNSGQPLIISSKGISYSALILLSTVGFLLIAMHLSKWKLSTFFGIVCLVAYVAVITVSCLFELNVFGDFVLPPCPKIAEG